MKSIEFENVEKRYKNTTVIKNLNLKVNAGERLILLGPSGCGKSTILRMIAGFEEISRGKIYMGNTEVNNVPSGKRNIAMVFQNYALYPHMSVRNNIEYGLKARKVPRDDINKRVENALEILQLKQYESRKPNELSGGQRQRVALARAIVKKCDFLLLDEPLSNLDAKLRVSARKELVKLHEMYKQTFIYVTHDQMEAMSVGHRIALMNFGELQMLDTPENVYNKPANIFTAQFIGSPSTNITEIEYSEGVAYLGNQSFKFDQNWKNYIENSGVRDLSFGIRPEHVEISHTYIDNSIKGVIEYVENYGKDYGVSINVDGWNLIALSESRNWEIGKNIFIRPMMEEIHLFDRKSTNNIGYPENIASRSKGLLSNVYV